MKIASYFFSLVSPSVYCAEYGATSTTFFIEIFDSLACTPGFLSSDLTLFVSHTFVFLELLCAVVLLLRVCALVSVGVGFQIPPKAPLFCR